MWFHPLALNKHNTNATIIKPFIYKSYLIEHIVSSTKSCVGHCTEMLYLKSFKV